LNALEEESGADRRREKGRNRRHDPMRRKVSLFPEQKGNRGRIPGEGKTHSNPPKKGKGRGS